MKKNNHIIAEIGVNVRDIHRHLGRAIVTNEDFLILDCIGGLELNNQVICG
jgi:nucleoside-triphosphatase THEP1